jgi:Ca2+/H+ antiporter
VEYLLNLLWLAVVALLSVAAVRAHARGQLRCSLRIALGCVALLAIVLFPALSMTDDLQRARLDTESMGRHLGDSLLLGSWEDAQHLQTMLLPMMMLMLWAGCMVATRRISRDATALPGAQIFGMRPEAIRPPPALA